MKPDITTLDMTQELFIGPRKPLELFIPPQPEEHYIAALDNPSDGPEALPAKMDAIRALVHLQRAKAAVGGRYTPELAAAAAGIFKPRLTAPLLIRLAAEELMSEGNNCEQTGDYQGAAWIYQKCLEFHHKDTEFRYYQHNNLAFCLIFLKRFKEAGPLLRRAIHLMPRRYNAFKNLGVALEHQGRAWSAAKCFMCAINYSGGEKRAVKHLLRLIERNPGLRSIPHVIGYLESLMKHGVIPRDHSA